ncbi:hypothetical protein S40288_10009 [Stachybotrys chartarum IBT 40288]|nr:hypothetical protein S40288_10009 [Stachybotrys chartarum IBT 40288]
MTRVILIFGAGPRIGQSVGETFKAQGYKIAFASRALKTSGSTSDELHIPTDCSSPDAVINAFNKVHRTWGAPHVVYNAYAHQENNPKDVFEVPLDVFTRSAYVNIISGYVAT